MLGYGPRSAGTNNMKELTEKYLNKKGYIVLGGLSVHVLIKDVKRSYGRDRFLVTPINGKSEIWVEKVKLLDNQN